MPYKTDKLYQALKKALDAATDSYDRQCVIAVMGSTRAQCCVDDPEHPANALGEVMNGGE